MQSSTIVFFFNDTATTEIYTLSLHDALPISLHVLMIKFIKQKRLTEVSLSNVFFACTNNTGLPEQARMMMMEDRKSTRLNSSHANISYAVFCLKKKKQNTIPLQHNMNRAIFY